MTNDRTMRVRALAGGLTVAGAVLVGCQGDKPWREAYGRDATGDAPLVLAANDAGAVTATGDAELQAFGRDEFFDPFAVGASGGRTVTIPRDTSEAAYALATENQFAGEAEPGRKLGDSPVTQASFSMAGADFDPDVSPDGKQIVFASTQHRHTADIYVKRISSLAVSQLTSGQSHNVMPKFSPDGSRIAFASNRTGNWDIYVMAAEGGKAVQITSTNGHDLHPSWSPDGRSVVFCRLGEVSGTWELWVTEVNNTAVQHFIGYGMFPEWCPRAGTGFAGADQILFQRSRERGDRAFGIWTIDVRDGEATHPTEIVSSAVAACINPTWSEDGRWVVFATVPNPETWRTDKPESSDLWLASMEGHGRVNLTSSQTVDLMPTWGSGNRVFFVSDRTGIDNIWEVDAASAILAATGERPAGEGAELTRSEEHAEPAQPDEHGEPAHGHEHTVNIAGADDGN